MSSPGPLVGIAVNDRVWIAIARRVVRQMHPRAEMVSLAPTTDWLARIGGRRDWLLLIELLPDRWPEQLRLVHRYFAHGTGQVIVLAGREGQYDWRQIAPLACEAGARAWLDSPLEAPVELGLLLGRG